jgi:hypothetical protein
MAPKIVWDEVGKRLYETGIDRGVLYPIDGSGLYPVGVAWNGLTTVTESPTGAEANPQYADNIKYLNLISREEFAGSIEAFTYPNEFALCDGSAQPTPGVSIAQQSRKQFGFAFRTVLGNDLVGIDYGYKLHLVWGAFATPSEKAHATINDSPEAINFSWDFTTTPQVTTGYKPIAHMVLDSTLVDSAKLIAFEIILYGVAGSPGTAARLPLPSEVITLMTP